MIYYLSRLLRYKDINLPKITRCRAFLWINQGSLNQKCDCKIWCKYPPTDVPSVDNVKSNNNIKNNTNFI